MNLCSKEDDFSANLMRAVVRKASDKTKNKKHLPFPSTTLMTYPARSISPHSGSKSGF